jgi:hypothetical protein
MRGLNEMAYLSDDRHCVDDERISGDQPMRMTTEEIEVRVWAAILLTLAAILLISVIAIIGGVLFVEQDKERIAPIDQAFLAILKDVMLLCIGAVGGIAGRKGAYAAANLLKKDDDATPRPTT